MCTLVLTHKKRYEPESASRQGRLYKLGYGDSLGPSASGCLLGNTPKTNSGLMGHVTLAALRRPSGNHTAQLDLGERISGRQVCWLDFCLLDTARVICRRREPQVRRRFHQNSLHSVEAFSQLLTDMGKYTHIRPSPGPPLGKIFLEGVRKKS